MNGAQPAGVPAGFRRQDGDDRREGFTSVGGQTFYRIGEFDRMPAFLMSLVSDSDLWMYLSSYGGLTAGRVDEDHCLFPYRTDDRIHLRGGLTGPITLLRVRRPDGTCRLWEPFTDRIRPQGARRDLYKSAVGNCVVFEETHGELGMTFRYGWVAAEPLGFVRTATLSAHEGAGPMNGLAAIRTRRSRRRRRLPSTTTDAPPCSRAAGASPTFWFRRIGPTTTVFRAAS